jgi:tetratricopeptide (TPR) repeat protein
MRKALYGDQPHPLIASSLNSVGVAYQELGDAQKSLTYFAQALEMQKALYGDQPHLDIATSLNSVSWAHWTLGEVAEAMQCYEEALKVLPEGHGLRQGICHNLGCAYHLSALKANTEEDKETYLNKATASFEAAVAAGNALHAGVLAEYANFLLRTDGLQQAYTRLTQAIASGDDTSELGYGLLEQATVALPLQERITQDGAVAVRAIDYAYYLLLRHYEAFEKIGITPEATREAYLDAYTQGICARAGQPGKEKQDEVARCLLLEIIST